MTGVRPELGENMAPIFLDMHEQSIEEKGR